MTTPSSRPGPPTFGAAIPFGFAFMWAASYSAAKIGLQDITPYAFVAVRLALAAGAAVIVAALVERRMAAPIARIPHLIVSGALVHGLALSTAHAALVTVDATPTALVHAFHPILTAALGVWFLGERFRWWQWLGVALGFTGVMLGIPLTAPSEIHLLLGLSLFGLSAGTLYFKRFCAGTPPFSATAVQLIGGAAFAFAAMLAVETPHLRVTWALGGAMAWNVFLMSIVGMAVYNLMLTRHGAAKAASGFFAVPGLSALVAFVLLGEALSILSLVGLAAATAGVILVWWQPLRDPYGR